MRKNKDFWAGFGLRHIDKTVTGVLLLFVILLSTLLVGYVERQEWLTTTASPVVHVAANNSRIWYRDSPKYVDENHSDAAVEREPALVLAMEKLRLSHVAHGTQPKGLSVGEYGDGQWKRQPEIDRLWVKLVDNLNSVKHVCHVGVSGGYAAVMYLQALSNATVSVFDACDGDRAKECDVFEKFVQQTYGKHRFTLVRNSEPAVAMVKTVRGHDFDLDDEDLSAPPPKVKVVHEKLLSDSRGGWRKADSKHKVYSSEETYESAGRKRSDDVDAPAPEGEPPAPQEVLAPPCDWIGVDVQGNEDTPVDLLSILRHGAACPNILFVNSIGRATTSKNLATIAEAWERGIRERVATQSRCGNCYENRSECTFCTGELLCGSVFAAAQQQLESDLEEEAERDQGMAHDDEDDDGHDASVDENMRTNTDESTGSEDKSAGSREKYDEDDIEQQEERESEDNTVDLGHGVKIVSPVISKQ